MASDLNDEDFRNELVELFALEAEEWLQQAKTAVQDLQHDHGTRANPKLLDIIQQALSNLGGSAAISELPEIERLAYEVLPQVETIRSASGRPSDEHLDAMHGSLDRLMERIRAITGEAAPEEDQEGEGQAEDGKALGAIEDLSAAMEPASPHIPLDTLRQVQEELAQAGRATRNLLEVVIERAREKGTTEPDLFDKGLVTRALRELEGLDEQFLAEVQKRMPDITQSIVRLKTGHDGKGDLEKTLKLAIESVQALSETARRARAASIVQFLQGLSTFLDVIANHGATLVMGRLDAVEFRLGAVVPMVQQWVEMGRIEREAIGTVLTR